MKFSSVKTILIVLLLLVNGFLAFQIMERDHNARAISAQTIADAASALKNQRIDVDSAVIPYLTPKFDVLTTKLDPEDAQKIAVSLFGKNVQINHNDTDSLWVESEAGDSFRILSTGEVVYQQYNDTGEPVSLETARRDLRRFFEGIGLSERDYRIEQLEEDSGRVTVKVVRMQNAIPVFDAVLTASFSENGSLFLSGKWVFGRVTERASAKGIDAVNLLFHFAKFYPGSEMVSERITVESIAEGYLLASDAGSSLQNTRLFPAWSLSLNNGDTYYFDTIKNEFFKQ